MIPWLEPGTPFPPIQSALKHPNGLLAASGDLSPERLLEGYRRGIFPWFSEGDPIFWWSPDPRMILYPEEFKISRSFAKTLRNRRYSVRFDSAFGEVMAGCAAPRRGEPGTWITGRMLGAYASLHRLGYAHSVETWIDGELAGGLYGVAIGQVFFGESMFSRARDASKIALAALVAHLKSAEFRLIDCQMRTPHVRRAAGPAHPSRTSHVEAERSAACGTAVLRDGALSVQLSARQDGALAGRDAKPLDRHRAVRGPGAARLSPQRHLHLPALLRPLPRLRPGARPRRAVSRLAQPAPRLGDARGAAARGDRPALSRRALLALPALPGEPPRRRRNGPGQPRPVLAFPAAEPREHAAG